MKKVECYLVIIIALCLGCHNNAKIDPDIVLQLKQKYSKEVINYVYNSIYFNDSTNLNPIKWKNNILIYKQGALWETDSLNIENAFEQINSLDLGFHLKKTSEFSNANIILHFGDSVYLKDNFYLDDLNFCGQTRIQKQNKKKNTITILINNSATIYSLVNNQTRLLTRQNTILHELVHALGIIKDNIDDQESIMFAGHNFQTKLSERDKDALFFSILR